MKTLALYILLLFSIIACKENYSPKPFEYFRIDLPEKKYTYFDTNACFYSFQYPVYSRIEPYTNENNKAKDTCWINIFFPDFKATIHITYHKLHNNLYKYIEECHMLAYKHDIKADAINETLYIDTLNKIYGMVYEIKGNAASPVQFYLTDSVKHFVRGSLYFNVKPNKDSLAPVIEFIKQDIKKLIETFKWK
jgi:gliding motility-associated lipoprotein GldD